MAMYRSLYRNGACYSAIELRKDEGRVFTIDRIDVLICVTHASSGRIDVIGHGQRRSLYFQLPSLKLLSSPNLALPGIL